VNPPPLFRAVSIFPIYEADEQKKAGSFHSGLPAAGSAGKTEGEPLKTITSLQHIS